MEESKRYHQYGKLCGFFGWGSVILAMICMVGEIVSLVVLGLGSSRFVLFGILCGAFLGGTALFGSLGFLALWKVSAFAKAERDALERERGENCFYVGEGTLATFGERELVISGEKGKRIAAPYSELRFFSIVERKKPREKGEWSVLIELPARYFLAGKAKKEEPPVLVQTEGKERLVRTLEARGLALAGERPGDGKGKFERLRSFGLPEKKKRKRAVLFAVCGAVLTVAGFALAFFLTSVCAVVAVAGLYLCGRAAVAAVRAKQTFAVYREGVYFRALREEDCVFLKWEDINGIAAEVNEGRETLRAECAYGAYEFPRPDGAYEYLAENFPQKVQGAADVGKRT